MVPVKINYIAGLARQHALNLLFSYFYNFSLNRISYIGTFALLLLQMAVMAQPTAFRQEKKWGFKDKELVIVKPVYDTVFNFDSTGKVCMACHKTKTASTNKIMKVLTTTYACNYFNAKGEALFVKNKKGDTCSVFSMSKNSVKQYQTSAPVFAATVRNKKYLVNKDFLQLTFTGYQEISSCEEPYFYVTQTPDEFDVVYTGLINKKEEVVVPYKYSAIKVNPEDSLIIACSATVRQDSEDDVFDYNGKKVAASYKHIDMATKNFLIHKLYEPKEHYLVHSLKTKVDKELQADDLKFFHDDEVLIKIKNEWFVYDLISGQKKPKSKS